MRQKIKSMSYYHFNADDLIWGETRAIVTLGAKRLLVENISTNQANRLRHAFTTGRLEEKSVEPYLFKQLLDFGVIKQAADVKTPRGLSINGIRLRSAYVTPIARVMSNGTTPAALMFMSLAALSAVGSNFAHVWPVDKLTLWFIKASMTEALTAGIIFVLTGAIHELGHAAASYRITGMVGGIRLTTYRGLPSLATDVSSVALAPPHGKAIIALSGAVFQVFISSILLCIANDSIRAGASASILSAAFTIIPLPNTDGYWFIKDGLQINIRPRLIFEFNKTRYTDILYGYFLLISTIYLILFVLSNVVAIIFSIAAHPSLSFSAIGSFMLAIYLAFVSITIGWRNGALFFS